MANAETIEEVFDDVLSEDQKQSVNSSDDNKQEDKPAPSGYMSKEAWIESGKNPDEWVSEEVFKERTQRIKETSRLKRELAEKDRDFESRLKNLNTLQQAQLSMQREKLLAERDEAIDVADKAAVNKIDKQIKAIDDQVELVKDTPVTAVASQAALEWDAENPWIHDNDDPRTPVAKNAYAEAIANGKSEYSALRAADKAVAALKTSDKYTEIKKKPAVSMADSSRSAASGGDSLVLSWSQLDSQEKMIYEEMFSATKTQKEYLRMVADSRTGVKK